MKTLKTWAAAALLALSGTAQAELVSLGDGTVKDTNTNLIWLQDWHVNGFQNWSPQKAWAESLDFAGSTEWRLPEISEYGALFNAYGNLTQVGEFKNVQFVYWSGTEYAAPTGAWGFVSGSGQQLGYDLLNHRHAAVAVRRGDVATPVPEPQTLALALLALGATAVARRRLSR